MLTADQEARLTACRERTTAAHQRVARARAELRDALADLDRVRTLDWQIRDELGLTRSGTDFVPRRDRGGRRWS